MANREPLIAPTSTQRRRRLSARQRQVAACASLGHSNKRIAYDLGLHCSTVATHLSAAAHKLGVSSRQLLIACWAEPAVSRPAADTPPSGLTTTERAIALAVVAGGSNREIARTRGISARTVANHLANIYRKLGVGSRAELAARCVRGGP